MHLHARRLFAGWLSLWFALSAAAPQLVHPCPEHTAAGSQLTDEHAVHHGEHGASSNDGAQQPSNDADCCCPGPQCGAGAAVLVDPPAVADGVVAARALLAPEGDALGTRERPAYSLPYSTAPPASLA